MTRRDLEHSTANDLLRRHAHGIYAGTGLPDEEGLPEALALLQGLTIGTPRVASFDTAATLWGLLHGELHPPFHLSSPAKGCRTERPQLVIGHRIKIPVQFVTELHGVRVTDPAWTWLDLSLLGSKEGAVVLGDQVIRHPRREYGEPGQRLAAIEDLRAAVRVRGRTRGICHVREALELIREGVDSPQETRLRYYMHLAGLPEPRVNPVIHHASGYPWFQPDLAVEEFQVSIQYEGEEFHSTPASVRKDARRSEIAEELGWLEVRITRDHMEDQGRSAVARIQRALAQRGWRPRNYPPQS